jgi:hypothetical protein
VGNADVELNKVRRDLSAYGTKVCWLSISDARYTVLARRAVDEAS